MSNQQLVLEVRQPTPEDYRIASMKPTEKDELSGDIKISKLEGGEVEKLYKRADDIKEKEEDEKEFFKREKSIKPPKTGSIIEQSFPPEEKLEKPAELLKEEEEMMKELKVIRYMPEGNDFETIPHISVTFNQPMIPLTGVDDIKKYPVPVKISPEVEGEWRWIGTKSVKWKPTYRLPKSTVFKVTVEGAKSELGCELKKKVGWSFTTIPLRISKFCPGEYMPVGSDAIGFVEFNQKIDPEKVLKYCSLQAGGKKYTIIPITPEEAREKIESGTMKKKHRGLYNHYDSNIKNGMKGRFFWFLLKEKLQLASQFVFNVGEGCPSAEGPRVVEKGGSLTRRFSTYGPLVKTSHYPTGHRIVPNQTWSISFSNNLELDDFVFERDVVIKPPMKDVKVTPSGSSISIHGQSKGNTDYYVTFNTSLTDIYGQKLEKSTTVHFHVGRAMQSLYGFFNNQMIVHDMCMNDKPVFEVVSINLSKIRVVVYQVDPWEYHKSSVGPDYSYYTQQFGYRDALTVPQMVNCGNLVYEKVITVRNVPDELVETIIPLSDFLQHPKQKCGQLFVYVEPDEKSWKNRNQLFRYAPRIKTWIQVTHLACDAIASCGGEVYGFCSKLQDGQPVDDVKFSYQNQVNKFFQKKLQKEKYENTQISAIGKKDGSVFLSKCTHGNGIIIARKGDDVCFVANVSYVPKPGGRMLSYIINDRNLYKPKETVSVKGIFRLLGYSDWSQNLTVPKEKDVKWTAYDPRGSKLKEGVVKTNSFGSFFMTVDLPDNVNLGQGRINFLFEGANYNHYFKIQEFRTPEFSSSAIVEPGPYFMNQVAIVNGKAEYFSGGGLSGCDVNWQVSQNETSFYPPNFTFKGYTFSCEYKPLDDVVVDTINPFGSFFGRGGRSRRPMIIPVSSNDVSDEDLPAGHLNGKTDGSGENKLCVDFKENKDVIIKKPTNVVCNLNIQDINRQMMSSSTTFLVHPSKLYVGIKKNKYFAKKGDALPIDLIVCDINGVVKEGIDIELSIYNRSWVRKGYNWKQEEQKILVTKFQSKKTPLPVDLKLDDGGTYWFVAKIVDDQGMANYSSSTLWVSGGKEKTSGGSRVQQETARLVGNKTIYQPGDEAKILVSSPFSPAEGMMVVICNGYVMQKRFRIEEDSCVLTVPVKSEYVPNCIVQVFLDGASQRIDDLTGRPSAAAPSRPAFAVGSLYLSIPPKRETLDVEVVPERKIMKPGESSTVSISVKSKTLDFKENGTAVSLIIVDEAVLSLTGYTLPHPISSFHTSNSTQTNTAFFRSRVVMKNWSSVSVQAPPEPTPECCRCCCGSCCRKCCSNAFCACSNAPCCPAPCCQLQQEQLGDAASTGEDSTIEVRTDFCPLACFIHDTVADKEGKAVISFKLPDNLTRYRVWVLAHSELSAKFFGLGESSIQAQLPVAIRPSLPRFLNYGDEAQFTVVVQNQTLDTVKVKVAVRMTNLRLVEESDRGMFVEIPYNRRAELRFPVKTHRCGTGRFQIIGAVAGTNFADAVEKDLPIFTPSTSEAFATYGEVDGDGAVVQSVIAPETVYNQFGGLSITTSSTALQSLTDAFLYLYHYKFDCVEQISSRMLSINALQKFLYEFNVPKMPTKREISAVMETGFKKIRGCMKSDGSIGFWSLTSRVNIYLSIYVAHNLIRCKEAGYAVDKTLLNRSKAFCTNVDTYINKYCIWYGEYSKASLRAFALYVLTLYGIHGELSGHEKDNLTTRAEKLFKNDEKYYSHEGKMWLMFCLFICSRKKEKHPIVQKLLKWINNNVEESPETAHFITSYGDDGKLVMLHSNRRTDGVVLEVLCYVNKKNYLIPKIVKGLLANRKKGRWSSTQENVYILMALKKYFQVFENVVPDFLCRVWLGEDYAGELKFKGREVDYKNISIPMKVLVPDEDKIEKKDLIIWKKGPGRLYYRLGMDYAPKSHDLKPIDYGFVVERTYEGVTKKEHVKKLENGNWEFKAGELIRVKLRLTNVSRRFHVALVDSIPAGCEVLNPELKGTQKVPSSAKSNFSGHYSRSPYAWCWWYSFYPWYEHVNLRDERVEAFSSYLYCGTHEYEFIMRATSLGRFVVPPTKAEEMYAPELFGRSQSDIVFVKE